MARICNPAFFLLLQSNEGSGLLKKNVFLLFY